MNFEYRNFEYSNNPSNILPECLRGFRVVNVDMNN